MFSSIANDDISCPPEETTSHVIGAPISIPIGRAGGADLAPGAWAEYAMKILWKVARNARNIKTRAIKLLREATPKREPLQRSTTHYTGKRMDERINSRAANVESILIQIVGEVSRQECTSCLQNDGPWAKCIRFHDIDRIVTACGNCQWNGQQSRCDFYQIPRVPETPPRGHRRGRSSQSSISSLEIRMNAHNEEADAGLAITERLEQVVRQMQADIGLDDSKNAAIHEAIRADNFAELIVPVRAFIPTITPDQHRAQFDRILTMINNIKEQFANIRRT